MFTSISYEKFNFSFIVIIISQPSVFSEDRFCHNTPGYRISFVLLTVLMSGTFFLVNDAVIYRRV